MNNFPCAERSEIVRIFNEARAKRVLSGLVSFIAISARLPQGSLASLAHLLANFIGLGKLCLLRVQNGVVG